MHGYTPIVYVDVMPTETVEEAAPSAAPEAGAPPLDLRDRAVVAYLDSVDDGTPLTGIELGKQFQRSERWGRDIIAAVRPDLPADAPRQAPGSDGGHRQPDTPTADTAAPAAPTAVPPPAPPPATRRARGSGSGSGSKSRGNGSRNGSGSGRTAATRTATAAPTAVVIAAPPAAAPRWWQRIDGARVVAWSGFVFGSVMSIAANVLYTWLPADKHPAGWEPPIAQQVGAAVWPIALLLSVEVLSRVQWRNVWYWNLARYGGAGLVAIASGVISYVHLHEVLTRWNYGDFPSIAGPVVLDGLMIVSGFALLAMSETHAARKESA